jgi:hypothetical protein
MARKGGCLQTTALLGFVNLYRAGIAAHRARQRGQLGDVSALCCGLGWFVLGLH